jgi:hypothetical protein
MLHLLTQTALVLMAGIYAVRTTYPLLGGETFSPLTVLAGLVFLLTLALFHKLPKANGKILYIVVMLCIGGMVVNGLLLFAPGGAQAGLIKTLFSATCVVGWGVVAVAAALKIYGSKASLQSMNAH